MNISELRKVIYEEVVKAMRTELREILVEAVGTIGTQGYSTTTNSFPQKRDNKQCNITSEEHKPLSSILQETARNMSREDYRNLSEQQTESQRTLPGMPDFISAAAMKARDVLQLSNQKDLERHGL